MAENIPNPPGGALPPKKETGKVQPKKETVRINLPPKPTAAPTIKLPTLPPGGPTGAGSPAPAPTMAHGAPPAVAAPATRAAAAPLAPRPAAPAAPVPRSAPMAPAGVRVSPIDTVLAVVAMVVGLAAVGTVIFLLTIPTN